MDVDRRRAPVFIVGSIRSGTTLLYHTLLSSGHFAVYQAESDVYHLLAPHFGNLNSLASRTRLMDVWLRSDYFARTGLDATTIKAAILRDCRTPGDFLRIVMEHMCKKQGKERWVEKTPTHVLHIPAIKADIPDALFIHVIRDGRDVALSMDRQGWGWAGRPIPWDMEQSLLVAALYWEWLVQKGRSCGRALGNDYIEVRYEDLLSSPDQTLRSVSHFLQQDLKPADIRRRAMGALKIPNSSFDSPASAGRDGFIGRWKTLAPLEAQRLTAIIGGTLRELNYAQGPLPHLDFTCRRLRAFYRPYRDLKHFLKHTSPLARHFAYSGLLKEGRLNSELGKWPAFSLQENTHGVLKTDATEDVPIA